MARRKIVSGISELAVIVKNRRIEKTIPSHENKNIYSRRFY
jgi:hypothetical protein